MEHLDPASGAPLSEAANQLSLMERAHPAHVNAGHGGGSHRTLTTVFAGMVDPHIPVAKFLDDAEKREVGGEGGPKLVGRVISPGGSRRVRLGLVAADFFSALTPALRAACAKRINRMENSTDAPGSSRPQMLRIPYAHLPHGLVTFPRRILPWIEPWFLAYACLGVVQGGMLPLLLPLSAGGSTHAGTIVGVMNLAGLTAPFWGHLADRRRLHRQVLLAGMLVLAPLLLMPAVLGLPLKAALAGVLGLGFAAANTVSNMFIVEVRPKEEWDARIGALQALGGLGQVSGLLLAGFIGGRYALAFGVAAGLVAAAVPIAWMTLRGIQVPVARTTATAHPALGGESWASAPQRLFHVLSWRGLVTLLHEMEMPFARLLGVWFLAFVAISAVLTMFPLSLIQVFGVSVRLPATTYAFAPAVSLLLYPLAASAAKKHGARACCARVLRLAPSPSRY